MKQDEYNKIVTATMLLYFMIMNSLAWILQRPIDLTSFITVIAPLAAHGMHLLLNNNIPDKNNH